MARRRGDLSDQPRGGTHVSWHLTWQDPVAWSLIAMSLALFLRWRRRATQHGCSSCGGDENEDAALRVRLESTRLAERLKE